MIILQNMSQICRRSYESCSIAVQGHPHCSAAAASALFLALILAMTCRSEQYVDVGTKLEFDTHTMEKICKTGPVKGAASRNHNLEILMHLIDPERDVALINKSCDALQVSFPKLVQVRCPISSTRAIAVGVCLDHAWPCPALPLFVCFPPQGAVKLT